MEKEIEREVLEVESRGKKRKKKRRGWDIGVYVCGTEITREKEEEGNIWMKEWKCYHNIVTIFSR